MTATPLITTDEAKQQLNITSSDDDGEITAYIIAATELINARCGYSAPTTVTETVYVRGDHFTRQKFILSHTPVLSVTSITPTQLGIPQPDMSQVVLDGQTGVVYLANWWVFVGTMLVTYVAGRTSVPESLKLACKLIVQDWWDTQRGAQPLPAFGEEGTYPNPDGIPPRALQLMRMAPYTAGLGIA